MLFMTSRALGGMLVCSAVLVSACTTSPTGTTKDMFDLTSSTTPGSWYSKDGLLRPEYRRIAFATYYYETVKRDVAQGCGEHLASLATLLGVSPARYDEFGLYAQARYAVVESPTATPEELLVALMGILDDHPELTHRGMWSPSSF